MNVYERIFRIIRLFQEVSPITIREIADALDCQIHIVREDVKLLLEHKVAGLNIEVLYDMEEENDLFEENEEDDVDLQESLMPSWCKDILTGACDDLLLYAMDFDDEFCTVTLNSLEKEFVKGCISGNLTEENIIIKKLNAEDKASFDHIQQLDKAIRNNQKVEVVYKSPKSEKREQAELTKKEFFPIALVKFVDKNIYYVVKIKEGKLIHYRVDRIQSVKLTKETKTYSEEELSLLEKFDYMWSTENEEEPFEVKLRVTKEAGVYQRMREELQYRKYGRWEEDEEYYYYSDKVIGKYSFMQWIRKYGKSVLVMEPLELARGIYEAALLKREMYQKK